MKFDFIASKEVAFPVVVMCQVLGVSKSGYYAAKKRRSSARAVEDVRLGIEVAVAHKRSRGIYGSPRVHLELRAQGVRIGKKRVERLMRERSLRGRRKRRFVHTTDSHHDDPIAPNILEREFHASAPNKAWVGDVTYIPTAKGWMYLAVLLDLFSRRIVGWATSEANDTALARAALDRALRTRRPPRGLIHHTDRGSPYASEEYRACLAAAGIVASMSRSGDCYDNAVAESFFSSLKSEWVDHEDYGASAAAHASIGDYIERFYNPTRRHSHLGYISPVEFELKARIAAIAA